jgi:hypothetical protein
VSRFDCFDAVSLIESSVAYQYIQRRSIVNNGDHEDVHLLRERASSVYEGAHRLRRRASFYNVYEGAHRLQRRASFYDVYEGAHRLRRRASFYDVYEGAHRLQRRASFSEGGHHL